VVVRTIEVKNVAKAKRKSPDKDALRELYLKSGNQCAFPGCTRVVLNNDGVFAGQICHSEAAEEGGERFNLAMTDEERAAVSNLMLMCYEHHVITNDVDKYPVSVLKAMKAEHETRFGDPAQAILDGEADERSTGVVQVGTANRAVTATNSGTINLGDSHHHYHPLDQPRTIEIKPTVAEVEILTRLANSQTGYLNAVTFDGGFEVLIDGQPLGGSAGGDPSVQLHEAVERLLENGLLSDIHRNGQIYHLSTKGREAARQLHDQIDRGERPNYGYIESTMPALLEEMRKDFCNHPVIREIILLDSEGICYNGGGVFSYFRSVHSNLDSLFQILENNGLVQNITYNNTDRYRVSEAFARYLQAKR
jgi:hypothetical protein